MKKETVNPTAAATNAAQTVKNVNETEKPKTETIEELKKRLDIELARLKEKRTLAQHREQFINSMGSLQLYIGELKNENEFETKTAKMTLNILETDRYNQPNFNNVFSITTIVISMAVLVSKYSSTRCCP